MLLVADTHHTDTHRDAYRWDLFPWLLEQCQERGIEHVVFNGDFTQQKDNHSARLVNELVDGFMLLVDAGITIHLNQGNHDYKSDPEHGFFRFMRHIDGVYYYWKPTVMKIDGRRCLFLPHSRNPTERWKDKKVQNYLKKVDEVFIHQALIGSVSSSGYELPEGLSPSYFDVCRGRVWAGDIHVPQKLSKVRYIGAPYPINMNDHFQGRVLALVGDRVKKIPVPSIKRMTLEAHDVTDLVLKCKECGLGDGDQLKIRLILESHQFDTWSELKADAKKQAEAMGIDVVGVELRVDGREHEVEVEEEDERESLDDVSRLKKFCESKSLPRKTAETGKRMLQDES